MTVIMPTRRCFDDALEFVEERIQTVPAESLLSENERLQKLVDTLHIVHAIVRFPDDNPERPGERFAHAWVEERLPSERVLVWQAGLIGEMQIAYSCDRDEWYEKMRIQHRTAYTLWEALDQNRASGTYGPWLPLYQEMIAEQDERRTREQSAPHARPKLRSL